MSKTTSQYGAVISQKIRGQSLLVARLDPSESFLVTGDLWQGHKSVAACGGGLGYGDALWL